ncbi:MAG: T9SS type A sorting domain-containing protein, partial [Bacteroidota bacterium]
EYNNEYFTIERSINGKDFEAITKIPGAGFSNAELNYQTIDPTPQIGINYYRLQQTDFDGSSTYSDIQAVSFKNEDLIEVSIYPNPTSNYATLFTPVNFDNGLLEIYDLQGKRVLTKQLASGSTRMEVQLAAWPTGIYLLKVSLDGQHTTRQLVVQE